MSAANFVQQTFLFLHPRKNQIIPNSKVMNDPHKVGVIKSQNFLIVRRTVK